MYPKQLNVLGAAAALGTTAGSYNKNNPNGVNQVNNVPRDLSQFQGRFAELAQNNPYTNFNYKRTLWDNIGSATGLWKSGDQRLQEEYAQLAKQYDAELLQAQSQEQQEMLYNDPAEQARREMAAGLNPNLNGIQSAQMQMTGTQGIATQQAPNLQAVNAENSFNTTLNNIMSMVQTGTSLIGGVLGFAGQIQGLQLGKKNLLKGDTELNSQIFDLAKKITDNTLPIDNESLQSEIQSFAKIIKKSVDDFTDEDWSKFFSNRIESAFTDANLSGFAPYTRKQLTNFARMYQGSTEYKAKMAETRNRFVKAQSETVKTTSSPLWKENEEQMVQANKDLGQMQYNLLKSGFELEKLRIQNNLAYQRAVEKTKLGDQKAMSEYYGYVADKFEKQAKSIQNEMAYEQISMVDNWIKDMNDSVFKDALILTSPYLMGTLGVQGYGKNYFDVLDDIGGLFSGLFGHFSPFGKISKLLPWINK